MFLMLCTKVRKLEANKLLVIVWLVSRKRRDNEDKDDISLWIFYFENKIIHSKTISETYLF